MSPSIVAGAFEPAKLFLSLWENIRPKRAAFEQTTLKKGRGPNFWKKWAPETGLDEEAHVTFESSRYRASQVGAAGKHHGSFAKTVETLADRANTATAIQSKVFFTVNLLVEVGVAP